MRIDLASSRDLDEILQLRREAFLQQAPAFYSPTQVKNLLGDYSEDQILRMISERRLFVARSTQRILGTAGWQGESVRHMYVWPPCMRQGIGSALLAQAEADYRGRTNNRFVFAGVILYAKGFYEKNGFYVLSREKDWDGSHFYLMRKDFPDSEE